MKKAVIAILLDLSVLFSAGISVCAYSGGNIVSPYYLYTNSAKSTLIISGNTTYCESKIKGDITVIQIYATQYLEKKNGNKWDIVDYWSDYVNGNSLSMSNSKDNLDFVMHL
ncbi:MAG: hypothetical protein NC253_08920 [Ruminococcus sp.]|nr:hypothetical protein [Ruminococcus sp.]MCM1480112.1 hypothetical protein [Muribaculaceae bacterium]